MDISPQENAASVYFPFSESTLALGEEILAAKTIIEEAFLSNLANG